MDRRKERKPLALSMR